MTRRSPYVRNKRQRVRTDASTSAQTPARLRLPAKLDRWRLARRELYRHRGKEPPVDRISVEVVEHFWWIDSGKAERELSFSPRDPQLTLVDTVAHLRQGVDAEA